MSKVFVDGAILRFAGEAARLFSRNALSYCNSPGKKRFPASFLSEVTCAPNSRTPLYPVCTTNSGQWPTEETPTESHRALPQGLLRDYPQTPRIVLSFRCLSAFLLNPWLQACEECLRWGLKHVNETYVVLFAAPG